MATEEVRLLEAKLLIERVLTEMIEEDNVIDTPDWQDYLSRALKCLDSLDTKPKKGDK